MIAVWRGLVLEFAQADIAIGEGGEVVQVTANAATASCTSCGHKNARADEREAPSGSTLQAPQDESAIFTLSSTG